MAAAAPPQAHLQQAFFVNHPEPPERTSGEGQSDGQHLLTPEFFEAMALALRAAGTLTLVTDNLPYARTLAGSAAAAGFADATAAAPVGIRHEDPVRAETTGEAGAVRLFEGLPGPEHGHGVGGSSYFDRLWKEGDKVKRYYFCVGRS